MPWFWRIVLLGAALATLVAAATQHGLTAPHAGLAVAAFAVAAVSGYLTFAALWRRDAVLAAAATQARGTSSSTARWSAMIGSVIGIAFGALIPGVILALIGGFLVGALSARQDPRPSL